MRLADLCLVAVISMLALAGCNQGGTSTTAASNESAPSTVASRNIDSEAKAREFATTHINEYIATQTFNDDAGEPTSPPKVEIDTWRQVEQNGDRWTLKRGPPGNWYFHASFNADGSDPEYEVVYFSE